MSDQDFRVVKEVPASAKATPIKDKVAKAIPYLFANLGEWCLLFSQPLIGKTSHITNQHGCHFRRSLEVALASELAYHLGSYDVESKRHIAVDEETGQRYTGVWFKVSYNGELGEYGNGKHKYHNLGEIAKAFGMPNDLELAVDVCDEAVGGIAEVTQEPDGYTFIGVPR